MTNIDKHLDEARDIMTSTLPTGVFIVANAAEIDRLRAQSGRTPFQGAALVALEAGAPVPADIEAAAHVLVIEVDPQSDESLRRVASLRAARDDLVIIAAIARSDLSLVRTLIRQGIADVASLPFDPAELATRILDASAQAASGGASERLAPMVTVTSSTGGCGASTALTHLAAALAKAQTGGRGVCVVDLDLQGGDIAALVGAEPKVTVAALLEAGDRLDPALIRSAVTPTRYGFSVIAAPEAITPLETVDVDYLLRVLNLVRKEFDHVLIDLPPTWTSWSLSVALASSQLVLLTDLSIAGLRQAKRRLQLFSSIGVLPGRIDIVANRLERRLFRTIGVEEAAEALRHPVLAGLASEVSALRGAQDQGLLVFDVEARSRYYKDIQALAAMLLSREG